MLDVEDWAEIRRLYWAEVMLIKVDLRVTACSENAVRKALAPTAMPRYAQASSEAGTVQPSNKFSKAAAAPRARFLRPK